MITLIITIVIITTARGSTTVMISIIYNKSYTKKVKERQLCRNIILRNHPEIFAG